MKVYKYVPDTITSLNLLSGTVAVVFACKGRLDVAFCLMLLSAVFDFFDGFAARLLKSYSDLGKQLDSLADLVSFGVLPSMMLFSLKQTYDFSGSVLCWAPLLIAVFSGIRLAKFNIDDRQKESFLGLPTPASAVICGSLAYFVAYSPESFLSLWCAGDIFIPVLTAVICALLVSEVPMFSLKGIGKNRKEDIKRICFVINFALVVAIVLIMGINWSMILLLGFVVYVLMNLVFAVNKI